MPALPCLECGSTNHRLSTGQEAYPHRPDLAGKLIWFCECKATVGCHPGTNRPLGAPAGQETKWARMAAHVCFDDIWESKEMSRKSAYKWLADQLGIDAKNCHIGNMDKATAMRVVEVCKARKTTDV